MASCSNAGCVPRVLLLLSWSAWCSGAGGGTQFLLVPSAGSKVHLWGPPSYNMFLWVPVLMGSSTTLPIQPTKSPLATLLQAGSDCHCHWGQTVNWYWSIVLRLSCKWPGRRGFPEDFPVSVGHCVCVLDLSGALP